MPQSISLIVHCSRCYSMVALYYPEALRDSFLSLNSKKVDCFFRANPKVIYLLYYLIIIYLFIFQVRFVKNVTLWKEMKPAFYHGHVSFLDFTKYVLCAPVILFLCSDFLNLLWSMCFAWVMLFRVVSGFALKDDLPRFCITSSHSFIHNHWKDVVLHSQKAVWCCWRWQVAVKGIAASSF